MRYCSLKLKEKAPSLRELSAKLTEGVSPLAGAFSISAKSNK